MTEIDLTPTSNHSWHKNQHLIWSVPGNYKVITNNLAPRCIHKSTIEVYTKSQDHLDSKLLLWICAISILALLIGSKLS